jgi:hypothetical protein
MKSPVNGNKHDFILRKLKDTPIPKGRGSFPIEKPLLSRSDGIKLF